jgi:hypothetical protein
VSQPETYVSVDVETDGPIPGEFSMLNLGAAAFVEGSFEPIGTFTVNLEPLPGARQHPRTMEWWRSSARFAAYEAITQDQVDPSSAMSGFDKWVRSLPGKPVFVGYPTGFDFTFAYWYLIKFVGESPFSFSAIDIKTYAMSLLKRGYRDSTKKHFDPAWSSERRHAHVGLDDAIEQGEMFMRMLAWNKARQ